MVYVLFKFCFYGRFFRRIFWLRVVRINNNLKVVVLYFLDYVEEIVGIDFKIVRILLLI